MHCLQLTIQGTVQGVGFRHFILIEARQLGLRGIVRNLPGGGVEVIAEGERALLHRLLERAWTGPPHASVTHVAEHWAEGPPRYARFGIES